MAADIFHETEQPFERVIVALDGMQWPEVEQVMGEVGPFVGMGKANSLAQRSGWDYTTDRLNTFGVETMADAKYKDIPETMYNHLREVTQSGPRIVTVHADNNLKSLQYAVRGRDDARAEMIVGADEPEVTSWINNRALILGITVLTSINPDECRSIYGGNPRAKVLQFARKALEAGLDGIVCSGQELTAIREVQELDKLGVYVPGITPVWAKKPDDQSRTVTPTEAFQRGASGLVIGRAITKPPQGMTRAEAAERIAIELKEAA